MPPHTGMCCAERDPPREGEREREREREREERSHLINICCASQNTSLIIDYSLLGECQTLLDCT